MRTITVTDRQTLVDIAIQYYGTAAAVIDVCIDNQLELDTNINNGDQLLIQDTYPPSANANAADYLAANNLQVISITEYQPTNVLGDNQGDILAINNTDYLGVGWVWWLQVVSWRLQVAENRWVEGWRV